MTNERKPFNTSKFNILEGAITYNIWKVKMKIILKREKLWDLVEPITILVIGV
jgi:hypothetical protein